MRLLTVGSVPPEWGGSSRGGVATVHRMLAEQFANEPIQYLGLMAPNRPHDSEDAPPDDITVFQMPAMAGTRAQRSWYRNLLKRQRPDAVLYFHIAHRFALWHITDMPDVAGIGSIRSWTQIHFAPEERARRARETLDRTVPAMRALIFPSRHTRDEGLAFGFEYPSVLDVIPNPLQPLLLQSPIPVLDERTPSVVFVGSLKGLKRAHLVLQAAASLGIPATIVGDGPEMDALQSLAQSLGIGRSTRFLGQVGPDDVARELAAAALLCVPSESESFGNVYLEALACGTPVVGFAPTLREIGEMLNTEIGAEVTSSASAMEVTDAVRAVLNRQWDRQKLRDRVTEICRVGPTTQRYLDAIERGAA